MIHLSLSPPIPCALHPDPSPRTGCCPRVMESDRCASLWQPVSQQDLFWKSWDFFRVIFKCLGFFPSSLRFIYGWRRGCLGRESDLQTCPCSKLSSGSASCRRFCIRLSEFLFLQKHLKFRHTMEGTQLSLQCGSTSVQQLGAIYEVCQLKLEKVTKQWAITPHEAWIHNFRLFNNIFIYFVPFVLNLNASKRISMKLNILDCRRGKKAQLATAFDRAPPANHNHTSNPNCLLVKRNTLCSRENSTFCKQIPNSSMHIFIAITSFPVPGKGWPKQLTCPLVPAFVAIPAPLPLARSLFHTWQVDSRRLPPPDGAGRSWPQTGRGLAAGRERGLPSAAAASARASGELSGRWEVGGSWWWFSTPLYLAVYNSRRFLLWWSFLTQFFGGNAVFWSLKNLILYQ